MKKKLMIFGAAIGAAMLLAGCSTVQTADASKLQGMALSNSGATVAHVSGTASGYYFLWFPLITGSTNHPGYISWFDEDSCNVTHVTKMVTQKAQSMGASRTVDLVSMSSSSMFPIPFPYLFYWKSATVSGNAIR